MTPEEKTIQDLADCLLGPVEDPTLLDRYLAACLASATFVKDPVDPPENTTKSSTKLTHDYWSGIVTPVVVNETVAPTADAILSVALAAKAKVLDMVHYVGDLIARAKGQGYVPPANPFVAIAEENFAREIFRPVAFGGRWGVATDLFNSLTKLVEIVRAELAGALTVTKVATDPAQISSFSISTAGVDGVSGENGLLSFFPDADTLKRKAALDALAALDFKARTPRLVFTAEYSQNDDKMGVIVGWRRIRDASGYVVKRRDIFSGREKTVRLDSKRVEIDSANVRSYVSDRVLSFYDNVDPMNVFSFVDDSVEPNRIYTYNVTAFQLSDVGKDFIFSVKTIPLYMSTDQLQKVSNEIVHLAGSDAQSRGIDPDSLSPYPAISKAIYGDQSYGWVLAAMNVRLAFERGESPERTRSYSYIGSKISFLKGEIGRGLFVIPADLSSIEKNIIDAVSKFGVTQTMTEVLDKTGMLFFFGEKDTLGGSDPGFVPRIGAETGILANILSAIDPETATVDRDMIRVAAVSPGHPSPADRSYGQQLR